MSRMSPAIHVDTKQLQIGRCDRAHPALALRLRVTFTRPCIPSLCVADPRGPPPKPLSIDIDHLPDIPYSKAAATPAVVRHRLVFILALTTL